MHGNYDLFKAVMNYCATEDPEYTLIFGGDACDRGPDGYRIMKELLDNPQVVYLMGNHEKMFVDAARFILNDYKKPLEKKTVENYLYSCYIKDYYSYEVKLSIYNGGRDTLRDWMLDGMRNDFVTRISKLPRTFSYENIDFCHAGGDPEVFARVAEDEYNEELLDKDDEEMVLWDRNWTGLGWTPNRILVYGHTPAYHLPAKYYGMDKREEQAHPCAYVGMIDERFTGKRVNMDCGTAYSNRVYVLNVLTMEAQGFQYDEKNAKVEKIEAIQM